MKSLRSLQIIDYVKELKYCSLEELRSHFGVSNATIHRDVQGLYSRGVLHRVRGGVTYVEQDSGGFRNFSAFQDRLELHRTWKQEIAGKALHLIHDGDILFLDASTTVSCLAEELMNSHYANLTIVTNSVTIIQNFYKFPSHYVLLGVGGNYDMQLNAFLGQGAMHELERLTISKAFFSAFGVTDVATTNHENHAALLGKVIELAQQKYLLVDRSKFDRSGLYRFAQIRAFDEVVTDR